MVHTFALPLWIKVLDKGRGALKNAESGHVQIIARFKVSGTEKGGANATPSNLSCFQVRSVLPIRIVKIEPRPLRVTIHSCLAAKHFAQSLCKRIIVGKITILSNSSTIVT